MAHGWKYCFLQTCKDFGNNTSLHGWKYIVDIKRDRFEKLLWWCIQIVAIVSAIYLFYIISKHFWITPTITTLETSNFHISKVPFPAVAVCDVNRISKRMALKFAKERYQVYNISMERMFRVTRALGKLYDYTEEDMDLLFEFNQMLESRKNIIQTDYTRFINTLLELTPSCSDNILKCVWKSKPVNCSEIFNFRRTMFGFCCTFNYFKSIDHAFLQVDNRNPHIDTEYLSMSGYETGLSLVLRSDPHDYYYPLNNMEGLNVLIYNPRDYPDTSSGGLVESLIPLQKEIFLQIEPITVEAVKMLQKYPRDVRGCVFTTEDTTAFDSTQYSYSDCLNDCRMRSILALCDCVPFYMSISRKLPFSTQLCTLSDIICLNKYKEKWNTMAPIKRRHEFDYEIQNSIECPHCLPACSYTNYFILNEQAPLVDLNSAFLKGLNVSEISLVHIYFDRETSNLYTTDLYYYWFDIISNFGGMCGVFLGLSLISVIEILYFFTFHFALLLKNGTNQK